MEQPTGANSESRELEGAVIKEKSHLELFHERYLTQEELGLIERGVKEEVLKVFKYNPLCSSYIFPRSSQVDECNNPNYGDGLFRRHLFNSNKIIRSLNSHIGIVEPPTKFKK